MLDAHLPCGCGDLLGVAEFAPTLEILHGVGVEYVRRLTEDVDGGFCQFVAWAIGLLPVSGSCEEISLNRSGAGIQDYHQPMFYVCNICKLIHDGQITNKIFIILLTGTVYHIS